MTPEELRQKAMDKLVTLLEDQDPKVSISAARVILLFTGKNDNDPQTSYDTIKDEFDRRAKEQ